MCICTRETGLKPGDRLSVIVQGADEYDLWGRRVEAEVA